MAQKLENEVQLEILRHYEAAAQLTAIGDLRKEVRLLTKKVSEKEQLNACQMLRKEH